MIKLVRKGTVTGPVMHCDVCGERITNASMAMYVWNDTKNGEYKIIHKRTCDNDEFQNSMELEYFFVYLMDNCGIKRGDLKEIYHSADSMSLL